MTKIFFHTFKNLKNIINYEIKILSHEIFKVFTDTCSKVNGQSFYTTVNIGTGFNDVCQSVPCIVSDEVVSSIIKTSLTEPEIEALSRSAEIL